MIITMPITNEISTNELSNAHLKVDGAKYTIIAGINTVTTKGRARIDFTCRKKTLRIIQQNLQRLIKIV
jgi:hypothetical protein